MVVVVGEEDEATGRLGLVLAHEACKGFPIVVYNKVIVMIQFVCVLFNKTPNQI